MVHLIHVRLHCHAGCWHGFFPRRPLQSRLHKVRLRTRRLLHHGARSSAGSADRATDLSGAVGGRDDTFIGVCDDHSLTITKVLELLVALLQLSLQNLDRGLQFTRLVVRGAARLFQHEVLLANLRQRALQVEDLLLLLLQFLRDRNLLLERDALRVVGEGHLVELLHLRGCLVKSWVLPR